MKFNIKEKHVAMCNKSNVSRPLDYAIYDKLKEVYPKLVTQSYDDTIDISLNGNLDDGMNLDIIVTEYTDKKYLAIAEVKGLKKYIKKYTNEI